MNVKINHLLLVACSVLPVAAIEVANRTPEPENAVPAPSNYKANPEDVATIDSIIAAVYDVISGPAGERDWDRMRSLFRPDVARLMAVGKNKAGAIGLRSFTPGEYIEMNGPYFLDNLFFESELSRKTEQFGHIAHIFSTYESTTEPGGKPFDRGINSIQLMWDEERWWVVTIYWNSETEANPIPANYLK